MRRVILLISISFILFTNVQGQAIPDIDRVRIAEAYRVGEKLQDQLWTGWSTAPFGMLFITNDQEFLIRHAKPNDEFKSIGYDKLLGSEVFVRPRKFQKNFLATFPAFGGTPVIVIGKAENTTDKTSTRWVFVVLHEHFHHCNIQGRRTTPTSTRSISTVATRPACGRSIIRFHIRRKRST